MLYSITKPYVKLHLNSKIPITKMNRILTVVQRSGKVIALDPMNATMTLESGQIVHTDLIIGADGIRSIVREAVVNQADNATPTGDAAYRGTVPTSEMLKDPDLRPLVDDTEMTAWLGPGRHIMAYNIVSPFYNVLRNTLKSLRLACEEGVQHRDAPSRRR